MFSAKGIPEAAAFALFLQKRLHSELIENYRKRGLIMAYIALYWGFMLAGYILGSRSRERSERFAFTGKLMLVSISALVLLMGMRMGSNEEVISNIGTIGLEALLITVLLMAAAVFSVTAARKILRMDKWGNLKGCGEPAGSAQKENCGAALQSSGEEEGQSGISSSLMTWIIIIFVVIGILAGYFIIRGSVKDMGEFDHISSLLMTIGLCILLFVIGIDLGLAGTVGRQLKLIGLRVLIFPAAMLMGTTVMGILIGCILDDLTVREALAISYGFGWYTFAPVTITNAGHVVAGAVSFMHNVFRETAGIVLIPVLAKRIGYIEVTALPGVAAMDICVPIVEKACRQDIIVYSFAMGMAASFLVPLLVPLALGV